MTEPRLNPGADKCESAGADGVPPRDALREAFAQVGELKEYASQYLSAKADGVRLRVRKLVIGIAMGAMALLMGLVVVVMAVSLFLIGLAEAISAGLGGRTWAGNLIVGGGLILLLTVGSWLALRLYFKTSLRNTVKRYERRLKRQRQTFGHDARQRSAQRPSEHTH